MNEMIMLLLKILLILCTQSSGMVCRTGKISFYSDAPLEKIEAHNRRVHITWDPQSGNAEFLVLMKAFEFKKALMQEHFNDNYVESHLYPKAVFKGVLNTSPVDLQTNQIIEVMARGNLTLHGVTRSVALPGTIIIQNGKVAMKAEFE